MSTAASVYFFHTHSGIKYVQIQNITTTAVLYGHLFPLRLMPIQELTKKLARTSNLLDSCVQYPGLAYGVV